MKIEKQVEDARGKIIFLSYNGKQVNLVEIRKNFSRGGHYHKIPTKHIVIIGKIQYEGKNVNKGAERIQVYSPNEIIEVPANEAHILTALEDSLFLEVFEKDYEATDFPEFRNIIESKIKN
ncbi:MAG: DUF4437 domain-containing protein [Nitrosotalea sp.]